MNYIIHLNKTFSKFCADDRLTPYHISLYFGLFQYWNLAKFRNPISISRSELMRASKIGSVNTYIRCLKELDTWQYIQYIPSYDPQKGSQVHLYNFDNANDKTKNNATDISNDKGTGKGVKKTTGKANKKPVIPSINNSNKTNKLNSKNKYGHTRKKSSKKSLSSDIASTTSGRGEQRKKVATKKESFTAPTLKEIELHFVENKWPLLEAEKFFNHYESNGWLVAGKTPMKNWKASSANWMLNSQKFSWNKSTPAPGNLHTSTDKNYAEPL
ncbi:MAG: transcriptional regulator [Bacteroidota bacterium]|nr:transcriptional regulator [Bacteroidota bacterium]MDP3144229.1 transcriptional regulator [Bacteroidota bacterium]